MATEIKKRKAADSISTWIRELGLQRNWHLCCASWCYRLDPCDAHTAAAVKTKGLLREHQLRLAVVSDSQNPAPVKG